MDNYSKVCPDNALHDNDVFRRVLFVCCLGAGKDVTRRDDPRTGLASHNQYPTMVSQRVVLTVNRASSRVVVDVPTQLLNQYVVMVGSVNANTSMLIQQ